MNVCSKTPSNDGTLKLFDLVKCSNNAGAVFQGLELGKTSSMTILWITLKLISFHAHLFQPVFSDETWDMTKDLRREKHYL